MAGGRLPGGRGPYSPGALPPEIGDLFITRLYGCPQMKARWREGKPLRAGFQDEEMLEQADGVPQNTPVSARVPANWELDPEWDAAVPDDRIIPGVCSLYVLAEHD